MGDILKEAIADAKAVRETALQNAKVALEEAFTPKIKSMLSAKLKEDDLDELSYEEEEPGEEEDEEEPEEMMSKDEIAYEDEEEHDDDDEVDEMSMKDEIKAELKDEIKDEIKTELKYEEEDEDHGDDEEEVEEISDLDLESVIKELESELSEGEDEDEDDKEDIDESDNPYDRNDQHDDLKSAPAGTAASVDKEKFEEGTEDDGDTVDESTDDDIEIDESVFEEDEDTVDEQSTSSGIGKGTGVKVATASDEEDPQGAKIVKAKMESVQAELGEYKEAVEYLKNKLHEVNLLNAKLLFTNKLFKEFTLDNSQKLKVVETFDRTQSTREIKLVYSTLCEQFADNGSIKKKSIKESASSAVGSTKPSKESSKVITEEAQVADRFRKLAGILKG